MPENKNQFNKWLALINIPIQMGIVIFVFSYFGKWLDEQYGNADNTYTKIVTLIGVFLALYNVIRQVNQLNKNDK
ncbi:MAG: AtpZ/AtpI family protein [Flavobacterium sp.]|uniref:AtpZ/AtpI family protein n=1 Tax=Flavobacterium celericrescens TaxID=2709780 RepID=A0ABX0IAP4_9FLAO|nr:AtpZ/AtpI family protein [Flavobacterium celericrescens]NHM03328.1 AtpZ/AtpI family protein [Flavobacterium celericrescens]